MTSPKAQTTFIPSRDCRVAIVGAGPAGSLLALALAQRGICVDLYERRTDPRIDKETSHRSINLGLSKRGMNALRMVGILEEVLGGAVRMRGRVIHLLNGSIRFQPYGTSEGEVLHSIDRNELNRILLQQASRYSDVKMHFEHRLVHVDKEHRRLEFEVNGQVSSAHPSWTIGADGAFSTMRRELQRGERAEYHQEFLEWGYKELSLPAGPDGHSLIEHSALHIWPRDHCLMVSHPNRNGSHTLTLFLPYEGKDSLSTLQTDTEVALFFDTYFPDLVPLIPDLAQQWDRHDSASLITTRTQPWSFEDWAVLVGDACHAVYPFYGQGMNAAFEDCTCLLNLLSQLAECRATAFQVYQTERRRQTDVLQALSKQNFVELKEKVRSPWFLARKHLGLAMHRLFPRVWKPLYTMIAHTTIPYEQALERSRKQENLVTVILGLLILAVAGIFVSWMKAGHYGF